MLINTEILYVLKRAASLFFYFSPGCSRKRDKSIPVLNPKISAAYNPTEIQHNQTLELTSYPANPVNIIHSFAIAVENAIGISSSLKMLFYPEEMFCCIKEMPCDIEGMPCDTKEMSFCIKEKPATEKKCHVTLKK